MTRPRRIYAMPVLGRYGLTHGLLAWARCRLWCEQNGATMVAPFWLKLRVGPYLRRERDKRNYFLLFHSGGAVSGLRRLAILARTPAIDVGPDWPGVPDGPEPVLLRFHNELKDNERKSFAQVVGHGAFLRRQLLAMTRSRYRPVPPATPFIGVHVRLGDFTPAAVAPNGAPATGNNTRLPIDWYADRVAALRSALGVDVAVTIFSDGSDEDLRALLSISGVTRAPKQESITDLLSIGQGAALIASASGFSLWGAFLGDVPRVSFPGQSIVSISADPARDIESGFGSAIPESFSRRVRERLNV